MKQSEEARAPAATVTLPGGPANDYDMVAYPGVVYPDTLPDRLAVIAILAGMQPAPPGRCRVLELGCGDGLNVIAMAHGLPESEFIGIDPAAQPIARGKAMIERLGMANVSLRQMGVEEVTEEFGQFDYIIAHGLYSWVPGPIRERILEVCDRRLAPMGVAYVSYNAYPGCHLRELARGIMRYHAGHFATPAEQIRQGRGVIKFLAEALPQGGPAQQVLAQQWKRVASYSDGALFHDDLNVNNQPFYFHEFMAAAEGHGLQYLGEAELPAMRTPDCSPEVQAVLQQFDPEDVVRAEQYRDFLRGRAFRQTLLCRNDLTLDRGMHPEYLGTLFIGGEMKPDAAPPDAGPDAPEKFSGPKNAKLETTRPLVSAGLRRLGAAWPAFVPFRELVTQARGDLGRVDEDEEIGDAQELAISLLQAAVAGALELRAHQPHLVLKPGEKPKASALARLQVELGDEVCNLVHGTVRVENQLGRTLLALLDGTRDRPTLRAAMAQAMRDAGEDLDAAPERLSERAIEEGLVKLARLGLLVG